MNARSRSRTKVPTGMCSMVLLLKSPMMIAGASPPWSSAYRFAHGLVRLSSISLLATRRESVSFHRPERSVTVAGSIRETDRDAHATEAPASTTAQASLVLMRARRPTTASSIAVLLKNEWRELPGAGAMTTEADHSFAPPLHALVAPRFRS